MNRWLRTSLFIALFPALVVANDHTALQEIDWLLKLGKTQQVSKLLESLEENKLSVNERQVFRVRILIADNKLEEAAELLEAMIEQDPDDANLQVWYGRANGLLAQQASIFSAAALAKRAKQAFEKAIELDPKFVPGYQGLAQYYAKAPAIAGGSIKKAKAVVNQLMALNKLQGTMSLLAIAQEDEDEALIKRMIHTLASEFPHSAGAQLAVGFHFQKQKAYDKAYKAFTSAAFGSIDQPPVGVSQDSHLEAKLGALYQLGRNAVFSERHVAEGISALKQYLEAETPPQLPSKQWAQFRLSKLYLLNDQKSLAKPILVSLKETGEDKDLVKQVRKALNAHFSG